MTDLECLKKYNLNEIHSFFGQHFFVGNYKEKEKFGDKFGFLNEENLNALSERLKKKLWYFNYIYERQNEFFRNWIR